MFVTYEESSITGYSKVEQSGSTQGGGQWYWNPEGGYFYANCSPCQFYGGIEPQDTRATGESEYSNSDGLCASSRSETCNRQGHCATGAKHNHDVTYKDYYQTYTSSASKSKVTCAGGLTSTQGNSENPYTKTAELACTTSTNSAKDVPFLGEFPTTKQDCLYQAPINPISLYAGGPIFPVVLDTDKTTTYCAQIHHENGECIDEQPCTGATALVTYYDGCGNADARIGACLPVYKTADPCPIYYDEPDCEYAYILSNSGIYIGSPKNVGPFLSISATPLSTDKAVEFNIESGKESPESSDTFSYINNEITASGLERKNKAFTNSFVFFGKSGVETSTYKSLDNGFTTNAFTLALRLSNEVHATQTATYEFSTGPGTNPCCLGLKYGDCEQGLSKSTTTDTLSAGKSYVFTHWGNSVVAAGEYFAFQPASFSSIEHLAWGEFNYSTSAGYGVGLASSYASDSQKTETFECNYVVTGNDGVALDENGNPVTGRVCDECVAGTVQGPVQYIEGPPVSLTCANLSCGCTGVSAETTQRGPQQEQELVCQHPCAEVRGIECKNVQMYNVTQQEISVFRDIVRIGDCSGVSKMSYDVSVTHHTIAETETTPIGGKGFAATLQKSEGLYYLDSKGSVKTATSYSLKQSKSDIADSHVYFAFTGGAYYNGAYYNPMGKTTQFGSDGAKKTFIALATGDATYLVGSPDGKSKKSNSTVSHDGDVHSYYISDPDAKIWNQASWPGHGVVNGKITTGTFSFSFNTGAFANSYAGNGNPARVLLGAKQTIVAHGGLNLISSKDNVSEKSFMTTYSTEAFSTSFDSTFKGAWIAKAVPYTYVATKSVGYIPNLDVETNHVISINCPGCDFPQPAIPIPLIADTSTHFIKGDKSLLYNNNATSYLWTHPAFKKKWGAGHAGYCDE